MTQLADAPPLSPEQLAELQDRFVDALPKINAVANFRFRSLPPDSREEAVAEVVAMSWRSFQNLAAEGRDPVSLAKKIAQYAAMHVANGRGFIGGKAGSDVLSRGCRRRHEYEVGSIDAGDDGAAMLDTMPDRSQPTPAEQAAFNLDLAAWKDRLTPKRRALLDELADGNSTSYVARKRGVTTGSVALLRRELQKDWEGQGR